MEWKQLSQTLLTAARWEIATVDMNWYPAQEFLYSEALVELFSFETKCNIIQANNSGRQFSFLQVKFRVL